MIRVNLLPEKKRQKQKAKPAAGPARIDTGGAGGGSTGGAALVAIVGVIAIVVPLLYIWHTQRTTLALFNERRDIKQKVERLEKTADELAQGVEGLPELIEALKNDVAALEALEGEGRVLWAEKLYQLADMAPENIYFTTLEAQEDVQRIETEASKQQFKEWEEGGGRGLPPEKEYRSLISQLFDIHGIAYAKRAARSQDLMWDFHRAMENYTSTREISDETSRFMDGFLNQINIQTYKRDEVYQVEVTRFTFSLQTKAHEG